MIPDVIIETKTFTTTVDGHLETIPSTLTETLLP